MIDQICKIEPDIKKLIDRKEYNYYALAPEQPGLRHPKDTPSLNMTKGIIIASTKPDFPFYNTPEKENNTGYAEQFNYFYGEDYAENKENYSRHIFLVGCKDYIREGKLDNASLKQAKLVKVFKINQKEKIINNKIFNTKCPYCGSNNMTADCDIVITGTVNEKKQITAKEHWTPETLTTESLAGISQEDIQGYCEDCGAFCDFTWKDGFIKGKGIIHCFSLKEAANAFKNIITCLIRNNPEYNSIEKLHNMGFTYNILMDCCEDCKLDFNEIYKMQKKEEN